MGDHHAANAVLGQKLERIQFEAVEPDRIVGDDGKIEMRVGIGVAVAREMFGAGQQTAVLHTQHKLKTFGGHVVAIFAEGAVVDHRVGRVVIDVGHGCKTDLNAQPAALARHFTAEIVQQRIIADGPEHQLARVGDGRLLETHAQSVLRIHRDHERQLAGRLVTVGQFGLPLRCALKKAQSADLVLPNLVLHSLFVCRVFVGVRAQHKQLTDATLFSKGRKHRIDPAFFGGIAAFRQIESAAVGEIQGQKAEQR